MARQHVVYAGALAQRVIQRQRRAAGNAGDGGDALPLQQMNDQLCAGEAGARLSVPEVAMFLSFLKAGELFWAGC